jgi:general secretion pathway protein G
MSTTTMQNHALNLSVIRARPHRGMNARGFTLLEVMIVIVIILAILGLVTVNLMGAKKKADTGVVQMKLASLKSALDQFNLDFQRYPAEEGEGLQALWNREVIPEEEKAKWQEGGYMKEPLPRDDWGSEWMYRVTSADDAATSSGSGAPYQIWSVGPDKQDGTADDIYPSGKKPTDSDSASDVGPPPAPTGG